MSIEQLLQKRYKVIAGYPNSRYKIGEILNQFFFTNGNSYLSVNQESEFPDRVIGLKDIVDCPHIFKPLEWWEDRELSDMPAYLRYLPDDSIHKVIKYEITSDVWCYMESRHGQSKMMHYYPATLEEYTNYQSTLSPKQN